MTSTQKYKIIAIIGATASGKTALAIEKALAWNAEIVSFDSRQFYREMNIGTAKPSHMELSAVPHHFIGHLPVEKDYSVGEYENDAMEKIQEIHSRGKNVVLVGGSGLYLQAVEQGIDDFPEVSSSVREYLNDVFAEKGLSAIQDMLKEKDPDYYSKADVKNPRRVIRALEICLSTGKPYSSFLGVKKASRPFLIEKINIEMPRDVLYRRIDLRVDMMIKAGLLHEVETLMPYRHCNAMQSVGYREFFDFFDGKISLEQAIENVKQNSRNYAKRQITWFSRH
ncbi:MAG: tRNA (adenosine(37)-N6)-dimethylallyltransferase MiaA [Flavobacteriales bacterium]|nr:tRNA (adenosine(37)-N6)-dimethylallyltransferase MiaA [Flavobacteriales bacterium]